MDNYILPGMLLKDANVFEMSIGDRVYDKISGRSGTITDIKEVAPEWVEAFITLDNSDTEVPASNLPGCIYLG